MGRIKHGEAVHHVQGVSNDKLKVGDVFVADCGQAVVFEMGSGSESVTCIDCLLPAYLCGPTWADGKLGCLAEAYREEMPYREALKKAMREIGWDVWDRFETDGREFPAATKT